jgi:hypothetical protein
MLKGWKPRRVKSEVQEMDGLIVKEGKDGESKVIAGTTESVVREAVVEQESATGE